MIRLSIDSAGNVTFIHDDDVAAILTAALGPVTDRRRASHVDVWNDLSTAAKAAAPEGAADPFKWWVDLTPSGGSVTGPFETRAAALAFEVNWINERLAK